MSMGVHKVTSFSLQKISLNFLKVRGKCLCFIITPAHQRYLRARSQNLLLFSHLLFLIIHGCSSTGPLLGIIISSIIATSTAIFAGSYYVKGKFLQNVSVTHPDKIYLQDSEVKIIDWGKSKTYIQTPNKKK